MRHVSKNLRIALSLAMATLPLGTTARDAVAAPTIDTTALSQLFQMPDQLIFFANAQAKSLATKAGQSGSSYTVRSGGYIYRLRYVSTPQHSLIREIRVS